MDSTHKDYIQWTVYKRITLGQKHIYNQIINSVVVAVVASVMALVLVVAAAAAVYKTNEMRAEKHIQTDDLNI